MRNESSDIGYTIQQSREKVTGAKGPKWRAYRGWETSTTEWTDWLNWLTNSLDEIIHVVFIQAHSIRCTLCRTLLLLYIWSKVHRIYIKSSENRLQRRSIGSTEVKLKLPYTSLFFWLEWNINKIGLTNHRCFVSQHSDHIHDASFVHTLTIHPDSRRNKTVICITF